MTEETQSFKWKGINPQGKRVDGVINIAQNQNAQSELKKIGIEIISLTPQHSFHFPTFAKKIKPKDIQLFTRFLSTLLAAGIPILQSLEIIGRDQDKVAMHTLINSLKTDIAGGKNLGETFSQYPEYFSSLYCNLIKAGEKSGTLDKILNRLAVYLEKTETLKRKIKKALTYPIAIMAVALIVSGILLIFVVPQFQSMFNSFGAKLPFFTLMIVHLSDFVRGYWWVIVGIIIAFIVLWKKYLKYNPNIRRLWDRWSLRIIIIGPVLKKAIIARYTRTLATTLEAGMPIVESMTSLAYIMGNSVYTDSVLQICDDISSGHTLSTAMSSTNLFPNMVIQMITIGENSGGLTIMLNKIADYYEEEVGLVVDNLSSLLEPLIMLILGAIVGTFVVAMYLPIFKIGSLF